jgi:two-component system LytT family sensor kinase
MPNSTTRIQRWQWLTWSAVFGVWTLLALLSVLQTALYLARQGSPIDWARLTTSRLTDWYTCALFTPGFFWVARHYPIERQRWRVSVPVHLGASALFVILKYALYAVIQRRFEGRAQASFSGLLAANFISELMIFWAVIAAVHAIELYRRLLDRDHTAMVLRAELAKAQLDALRSQLNPHFLFNALNGVSALMHRDVEAADRMVSGLGDLLAATLDTRGPEQIRLAEEVRFLEKYLAIMSVRFGDRLSVVRDVDRDTLSALVPTLILQPLVENAIEHGVARQAGPGFVGIHAHRRGDSLELAVTDNGPGLTTTTREGGVGLANTRSRLAHHYGDSQSLFLERAADAGVRATILIPFRTAELPA